MLILFYAVRNWSKWNLKIFLFWVFHIAWDLNWYLNTCNPRRADTNLFILLPVRLIGESYVSQPSPGWGFKSCVGLPPLEVISTSSPPLKNASAGLEASSASSSAARPRVYTCGRVYVYDQPLTFVDGCWLGKLPGFFVLLRWGDGGGGRSLFGARRLCEVFHSSPIFHRSPVTAFLC